MCETLDPQIYETLRNVVKGNIENFKITVHDPNKKGAGFLGEVVFVTLEDKKSGEVLDLVVKQAFKSETIRKESPIRDVFLNEIYFYTNVWRRLNKFQEVIPVQYQFQKLPKIFGSSTEENSEKIVLENLKSQNFELHDTKTPLNKDHYKLILKEYGKFHALSFAYKELHPGDYADLVKGILDIYSDFCTREGFGKGIEIAIEVSMNGLLPGIDDAVIEKYTSYHSKCLKLFQDSLDCNTKNTIITHGDCWSNNMMFKYDENGEVIDVRFLDFQLSKEGSPCCDLSYCLYSGAPKEVLDDFDYYLQIYHDSLSETLRAFGCDPDEIYPLHELKYDWRQYCKLGMMMGLMIWKIKYTYEDKLYDLKDLPADQGQLDEMSYNGYDKDQFNRVARYVLLHLYEHNFL